MIAKFVQIGHNLFTCRTELSLVISNAIVLYSTLCRSQSEILFVFLLCSIWNNMCVSIFSMSLVFIMSRLFHRPKCVLLNVSNFCCLELSWDPWTIRHSDAGLYIHSGDFIWFFLDEDWKKYFGVLPSSWFKSRILEIFA